MKNRDIKLREWKPVYRWGFAFLGLMLIATGMLSLLTGKLHYRNYWGAPVFAPFAIFVGLLTMIVAFVVRKKDKHP
jgi:hypothetical protein